MGERVVKLPDVGEGVAEAERVLADYAREEPRAPAEAHRMNSALATYYHKKKDYERAAARAREAYRITLGLARGKTLNARQRADTLYGTGAFLVDALVRSIAYTNEIWLKIWCSSSVVMPSCWATSASVGLRCRRFSRAA